MTTQITIDQSGLSAGVTGQSRDDLVTGTPINLTITPAGGTTYVTELISVPVGSSAALANANTSTPSFTADTEGTYLIKATVDGVVSGYYDAGGTFISTQGGAAVLLPHGTRIPGDLETLQFGGWYAALDAAFRALDGLL